MKKIIVHYNPKTNNPYAYISSDGNVESDVASIVDLFNAGNRTIEVEVGNELFIYYFRIMIKRKMIKHDELMVVTKNIITFNEDAHYIYPVYETELDKVLRLLLP